MNCYNLFYILLDSDLWLLIDFMDFYYGLFMELNVLSLFSNIKRNKFKFITFVSVYAVFYNNSHYYFYA